MTLGGAAQVAAALTAITFNQLGQYAGSSDLQPFCYAELAVRCAW